jgi:uncharacterized membrane protein
MDRVLASFSVTFALALVTIGVWSSGNSKATLFAALMLGIAAVETVHQYELRGRAVAAAMQRHPAGKGRAS